MNIRELFVQVDEGPGLGWTAITAGGVDDTKFISGEDNAQNWKSMKKLNFVFGMWQTLKGSLTLQAGEAGLVGKRGVW